MPRKQGVEKYLLNDGQERWSARWYDPDGTERRKRGFLTQEEADRYRTAAQKNRHDGVVTDPAGGNTLLRDLAAHHLEVHVTSKGKPLSPKTLGPLRGVLIRNVIGDDKHQKPHHLGDYPIKKITVEVIDNWRAAVAADAGDDQAAKSYRALKSILNRAVKYRWIGFNPCQIKGGGQESADERPIPEDDIEVQELAEAFEEFPPFGPRCKALVLMSAFGGAFRPDEMLSLRCRDVDKKRKRVHVGTKTEASKRWVYLPDAAWGALMEHMDRSDQYGAFSGKGSDGWVFSAPRGGRIWPSRFSDVWRPVRAKLGADPRLTLYDLRHYALTEMAAEGVPLAERMAHCGHVTERMQLRYEKARDRRAEENRDRLSTRWGTSAGQGDPEPTDTGNVIPIRRQANDG